MVERVDEKILDFINEVEKAEARRDIKNGPIKIVDRYYEFEEKDFFDEKLKMFIPKDFEDMQLEVRKLNYPPENGPDIIKCNEKGDTRITLRIIEKHLDEDNVENFKDGVKESVKNADPVNVFYEEGILEVDFKNIGFFEFKSYTLYEPLYNLMFFLEFEARALMGTFSCPYDQYGEWKEIAFQVIKTIRVIKEVEGDEN